MKESKADLILHPVRMRIVQSMLGGRKMTAKLLAEDLPDVPEATLYRHLNKLYKGGLLSVVDQNQIRGAIEKVYILAGIESGVTADDLAQASRSDHMRYFMMFAAGLLDDYDRYLEQDHFDLLADGVGYRKATMYLTDEEFQQLLQTLAKAYQQAMKNTAEPGRRRRTFSTIIIPEPVRSKRSDGGED